MNGNFSIEWMATSSQHAGSQSAAVPAPEPPACGTQSESLPGFYCWQNSENLPKWEQQENTGQAVETSSQSTAQQQTAPSSQATEVTIRRKKGEETSGYDSESGQSLSPSVSANSKSPPSPLQGRRPRTSFTAEQITCLEKVFEKNSYVGTRDKAELCKKLNLSDKQIRNWFQNRRMKVKRTTQDAMAQACQANACKASAALQLMQHPELQTYRPGPFHRYQSVVPAPVVAPEATAATSYVCQHSHVKYSSPLPSIPTVPSIPALPVEPFYQYSSLPGVMLPSVTSRPGEPYRNYPHYY